MIKKCDTCQLVVSTESALCGRCGGALHVKPLKIYGGQGFLHVIARRAAVCLLVCAIALFGFYVSLIGSARRLDVEERGAVGDSIAVLKDKGFVDEAFLLERITAFRGTDNWLNASVTKENAYAATNFPFEIITLYPDFFAFPADPTERAAILLHESKHLGGANEHDAYAFVWRNRAILGWTREKYGRSIVWLNIRKQTRENVPELFTCSGRELNDCTEP